MVLNQAQRDQKNVKVIWGEEIAATLDDQRQDLRLKHLGIPLRSLTRSSLRPALEQMVRRAICSHLSNEDVQILQSSVPRERIASSFHRLRMRPGFTLIVGDAGLGKTIWSASEAIKNSANVPTVWIPATLLSGQDIGHAIVRSAYGSDDVTKVDELIVLLKLSGRPILVFIDAIDECSNYDAFVQRIKWFRGQSALADYVHCVFTCRTEAVRIFEDLAPGLLPSYTHDESCRYLVLGPLCDQDSTKLLRRLGASSRQVSEIRTALPERFFGNPLYLGLAKKLHDANSLSPRNARWIGEFADYYVNEIRKRLRDNGRAPTRSAVQDALGSLAFATMQSPLGIDLKSIRNPLTRPGEEGEATFVERVVQSGLVTRMNDKIRFCHAVLCEYFVAMSVARRDDIDTTAKVEILAALPGRRSLLEFAADFDPTLLLDIARSKPSLVPPFQPACINPQLQCELIQFAESLLLSEFPSQRQAAVRILGTIGGAASLAVARRWRDEVNEGHDLYGASEEAAELLLQLEDDESFATIVRHWCFRMSFSDTAWYQTEFAERLSEVDSVFRTKLADYAIERLRGIADGQSGANFIMVLAYLRDHRLLDFFAEKARRQALAPHEHRALIHLNEDSAMEIYAESLGYFRDELAVLRVQEGLSDEERSTRTSRLWHRTFPFGGGVAHFPHDALVRFAERQLRRESDFDMSFGLRVAEAAPHSTLVDEYARVVRLQRKRGVDVIHDSMISKFVSRMDAQKILSLYHASDEAKKDILCAAWECGGRLIEDMMLNALDDVAVAEAACVGITKGKIYQAGPKVHAQLLAKEGAERRRRIKALGRLRYHPALGDLLLLLRGIPVGDELIGEEYDLVVAIGLMGDDDACEELTERYMKRPDIALLAVLLDDAGPVAQRCLHRIIEECPETRLLLGQAIAERQWLHSDNFYLDERGPIREYGDQALLDALIECARRRINGELSDGMLRYDCVAIAKFGLPDSEKFLKDLAQKAPEDEDKLVAEVVWLARRWLAERGDSQWTRAVVKAALDRYTQPWHLTVSDREVERLVDTLRRWPSDIVREELLVRADERPEMWLYVFVHFASNQDGRFIKEKVRGLDSRLVDRMMQKMNTSMM